MDIVVMLENGSIANVEIQKIGYRFPGERSACYSSDLLLRQYKRVRGRQKKEFVYYQIKNVYTIVISCLVVPNAYYIYTVFLFYLILAVYFVLQKQFSFSAWKTNLSKGGRFWIPVVITVLGLMAAFAITIFLEGAFPQLDDGLLGCSYMRLSMRYPYGGFSL